MENFSSPGGTPPQVSKAKKGGNDKPVTKRAVSLNRRIALVFAVVMALLVVLVLTQSAPSSYVLVVSKQIQPLTSLSTDNVAIVKVDNKAIENGALTSSNAADLKAIYNSTFNSKKVNVQMFKNQQLHKEYIAPDLLIDEQLISLSVKSGDAVVGKINAGDFVDVWAGMSNGPVSLVASNIQVYSLGLSQEQLDSLSNTIVSKPDSQKSALLPGNPIPGSYVLKIKTIDVLKFLAISNSTSSGGRVFVTLRSPDATATMVNGPIDAHTVICGSRTDAVCSRK